MLSIGLIFNLAAFYKVNRVTFCQNEDLLMERSLSFFREMPLALSIGPNFEHQHKTLLANCAGKVQFKLNDQAIWLEESDESLASLPLRLDSNVLVAERYGNQSISIREFYAIKGLGPFSHLLATYDEDKDVLHVPQPCKWDRRRNLRGVNLVNSLLPWKPMVIIEGE